MAAAAPAAAALAVGIYGPKRNQRQGPREIQRSASVVRREAELAELQASLESTRMLPCLGEMDALAQRTVRIPVDQYVPLTYRDYEVVKDPTIMARIREDAFCAVFQRVNQIQRSFVTNFNWACGMGGVLYYRVIHTGHIRKLAVFLDSTVNPITRPAGVSFRLEVDEDISFSPIIITLDILSEHNGQVVGEQLLDAIASPHTQRRVAPGSVEMQ